MPERNPPGVRRIRRGEANPKAAYRAGTRRKSHRSTSLEGMSTQRGNSRTHFSVTLDHTGWDKSIVNAKKLIASLAGNVNKSIKVADMTKSGVGIQVTGDTPKDIDNLIAASLLSLEKLPRNAANEFLRDIGTIGVSEIRAGIRNPENRPTSARYDTGLMYDSVDYKLRKNKDQTRVDIGWTRRFHKYFDFQERGTEQIGAMNAVRNAYRSTAPKVYPLMYRFFSNYSIKSGFSGRYNK